MKAGGKDAQGQDVEHGAIWDASDGAAVWGNAEDGRQAQRSVRPVRLEREGSEAEPQKEAVGGQGGGQKPGSVSKREGSMYYLAATAFFKSLLEYLRDKKAL